MRIYFYLLNISKRLIPSIKANVKIIVHIKTPKLIHNKRSFLGAPNATPMVEPIGVPNNSGDRRPKPIIPYFSQIFLINDFLSFFGLFNLAKIQILIGSPTDIITKAEKIAPMALATPMTNGFNSSKKPKNMPAPNSQILIKKTLKMAKIYSKGVIIKPLK
jgi:hypothetical protein